jgi:hypothetical protein
VATTVSISGSGKADVTVFGRGTVTAGNGDDKITITGQGQIVVGSGNDTLTLGHSGTISEHGAAGNDTIHIGSTGTYTITEQGHATVHGAFGSATINGGSLTVIEAPGHAPREVVNGGHVTIIGASSTGTTAGSNGSTHGQSASGHDSTSAGGSHTTYDFSPHQMGEQVRNNFVSGGASHFQLDTHSLTHLLAKNQVTMHVDQSQIHMDGGKTVIALHGVTISGIKH